MPGGRGLPSWRVRGTPFRGHAQVRLDMRGGALSGLTLVPARMPTGSSVTEGTRQAAAAQCPQNLGAPAAPPDSVIRHLTLPASRVEGSCRFPLLVRVMSKSKTKQKPVASDGNPGLNRHFIWGEQQNREQHPNSGRPLRSLLKAQFRGSISEVASPGKAAAVTRAASHQSKGKGGEERLAVL